MSSPMFDANSQPRLKFKIELEMLVDPLEELNNFELSEDDKWERLVVPLRVSLHNSGLYTSAVVNHGAELDAEKWCIVRDFTIRDENHDYTPYSFKFVSPTLPYYNLNSSDQYRRDLDIAFQAFSTHGCKPSSSCPTRVHVVPVATTEAAVPKYTLDQAKDVAKTVLRYSGALADFARLIGQNCYLPWDLQIGADISRAWERIGAAQSLEELATYMSPTEQNGPDESAIPRRPMWDFSSLTDGSGTIQCSLGPCSKSGSDAARWVHFACLFVQGALLQKGDAIAPDEVQDRAATYEQLQIFLRVQRRFSGSMVPGFVEGFDGTWCDLQNLIANRQFSNQWFEFSFRYGQ